MTKAQHPPGNIARAYACKTPADNRVLYDEWAATYDADMARYNYVSAAVAAGFLAAHLADKDAVILDAGCGTGLGGAALRERGFATIDGVDISPQMLAQADAKKIYRRLAPGDIIAGLDIADDAYDGLLCAGAFTVGHLPPACLGELARVVRPGGVMAATVNELVYEKERFPEAVRALEAENILAPIAADLREYVIETDTRAWYLALRVL